jgi:hypothetical protein
MGEKSPIDWPENRFRLRDSQKNPFRLVSPGKFVNVSLFLVTAGQMPGTDFFL